MTPPRPVTLVQVARHAGVSLTTASKAMNGTGRLSDDTRERVIRAARELKYTPNQNARSLITGRTRTIGLIMLDSLTARFAVPVMLGAEAALSEIDLSLVTVDAHGDHDRLHDLAGRLRRRLVDGLIVVGDDNHVTPSVTERVGVPTAYVYGRTDDEHDLTYVTDDELGGELLGTHLVEQGRTRIAHLTGPRGSTAVDARLRGVRRALGAHGLRIHGGVRYGRWSQQWGRQAGAKLLADRPDVDAVVCGSDQIATGVIDAVLASGRRVPEDVAITGYDNWPVFALESDPALTSVDVGLEDLGHAAATHLFKVIDGDTEERGLHTRRPTLVVRGSSVSSVGS